VRRISLRSVLAVAVAVASALAFTQPAGAASGDTAAATATFSVTQLQSIKASMDQQWASMPDSVASWYVDEKTSSVVVEVVGNDAAGRAFAKSGIGASAAVRTTPVAAAYRPFWNIIGGQALYFSAGRCSVGFNTRAASGNRYVITAGHCTNLGGTVSGVGGVIGPVAASYFPVNDFGAIRVSSTSSGVATALVDRYSAGSDVTVAGSSVVGIGGGVCRSGSTTGWHCGSVQAFNQTVNYGGGNIVYGLTKTNVCAEPGDSGGSFVSNPGTGTRVQAQGMTSGGSGNCTFGGTTFFQPINEVLSYYGLTLITG
jgi:streptogrisin C